MNLVAFYFLADWAVLGSTKILQSNFCGFFYVFMVQKNI